MLADDLTIRAVTARAVDLPLERPMRTASGFLPTAPLVLVDVATEEGVTRMLTTAGLTFSIISAKLTGRALPVTAAAGGAAPAVSAFEVPIATAPPATASTATTATTLPAARPRFAYSCVFIVLLLCWPVADGGAKRAPHRGFRSRRTPAVCRRHYVRSPYGALSGGLQIGKVPRQRGAFVLWRDCL